MNKRDSARILALSCHPVHTYSCLFALAAPRWHLEHLVQHPCVSRSATLPPSRPPRPPPTRTCDCVPIVPRRRLLGELPAADAIVKTRGATRKFMSNSRKYFTSLSHVRSVFLSFVHRTSNIENVF